MTGKESCRKKAAVNLKGFLSEYAEEEKQSWQQAKWCLCKVNHYAHQFSMILLISMYLSGMIALGLSMES